MSNLDSDELDGFRAELLRQKIIFEAELRRQRESFEERLASVTQELADREADCRNLQAVVTILGKKIDLLAEQRRQPTPRRAPTPTRSVVPDSPSRSALVDEDSVIGQQSQSQVQPMQPRSFARRPSPLISSAPSHPMTVSLRRGPSLNVLSRTNSPRRVVPSQSNGNGHSSSGAGTSTPNRTCGHPRRLSVSANSISARTIRSTRNRSSSGARRTNSTHRLGDVKASDDW